MRTAAQLTRRVVPFCTRYKAGNAAAFGSLSRLAAAQPNPRLNNLDLETLLQDVDIALHNHSRTHRKTPQELEVIPLQSGEAEIIPDSYDREFHENLPRKSPAALFGSQQLGAVVLPLELQDTIQRLISGEQISPNSPDIE